VIGNAGARCFCGPLRAGLFPEHIAVGSQAIAGKALVVAAILTQTGAGVLGNFAARWCRGSPASTWAPSPDLGLLARRKFSLDIRLEPLLQRVHGWDRNLGIPRRKSRRAVADTMLAIRARRRTFRDRGGADHARVILTAELPMLLALNGVARIPPAAATAIASRSSLPSCPARSRSRFCCD